MWQHHYLIHVMRMNELRAEAERERFWRLADQANGRRVRGSSPGRLRVAGARLALVVGRFADRAARRLDGSVDLGPDRLGTERLARDRAL